MNECDRCGGTGQLTYDLDVGISPVTEHCWKCATGCRHRCPECRMGLGRHLTCDPLCEARA